MPDSNQMFGKSKGDTLDFFMLGWGNSPKEILKTREKYSEMH